MLTGVSSGVMSGSGSFSRTIPSAQLPRTFTVSQRSCGRRRIISLRTRSLESPGQYVPGRTPHASRQRRICPVVSASFPVTSMRQTKSDDTDTASISKSSAAHRPRYRAARRSSRGRPRRDTVFTVHWQRRASAAAVSAQRSRTVKRSV